MLLSRVRFLRQLFIFILITFCLNGWATIALPDLDTPFQSQYRLPLDQESLLLPYYVRFIHQQSEQGKHNIIFLGASPTYGVNIKDPKNTYPYAYEQALLKSKLSLPKLAFYNVSSKGFLLSDQFFLLKNLIDAGDLFFIQLNYHTFSPAIIGNTKLRYPELPGKLAVTVTAAESQLSGLPTSPTLNLDSPLRSWLSQHWFFYREADRIALNIFGNLPDIALHHQFQQAILGKSELPSLEETDSPLMDKAPAQQAVVIKRYRETSQFQLKPDNRELVFLKKTLDLLKTHHKQAIFFMAPINIEALNYFEALNWDEYRRNTSLITQTIEDFQFPYFDKNLENPLTSEYFFDISHTLDPGGVYFGQFLFEQTKDYLMSVYSPASPKLL